MVKDIPGESHDHIHQKSAWFCHGDVIPEGIASLDKINGVVGVDFWSEAKGHGNIVCAKVEEPTAKGGQAAGGDAQRMAAWPTAPKSWTKARVIGFSDLWQGAALVVLDIDLHASVCPITFGDTKEGSMGIRINDQIRGDKGKGILQNAEGQKGEKDCWGRRSRLDGLFGPHRWQGWRGWRFWMTPKTPIRLAGIFAATASNAANPFGRAKSGFPDMRGKHDLVSLAKGDHLKLRYGLVLHDGDATTGGVPEVYRRFAESRKD